MSEGGVSHGDGHGASSISLALKKSPTTKGVSFRDGSRRLVKLLDSVGQTRTGPSRPA